MNCRIVLGFALLCCAVEAQTNINSFELSDQHGTPRKVSFPRMMPVIITIADQKGAAGMDAWIKALKARYGTNVSYVGIADVSATPAAMRPFVKARFRQKYKYPVLLDWNGDVRKSLLSKAAVPNVYFVSRAGKIRAVVTGQHSDEKLAQFPID